MLELFVMEADDGSMIRSLHEPGGRGAGGKDADQDIYCQRVPFSTNSIVQISVKTAKDLLFVPPQRPTFFWKHRN